MRSNVALFIICIFALPSILISCKKHSDTPNYLFVKKTITYDKYEGSFENLWANNGFLFAHIGYGNILKLDFDGNILDSMTDIKTNETLIVHHQNRLECFHSLTQLNYKYFDKSNVLINTGTISLNNETVQRHKLVLFKDKAVWIIVVSNTQTDDQRFIVLEIDSNGNAINKKSFNSPFAGMLPFTYIISSQNQLSIISSVFNDSYEPGTGIITLNNTLDTLWSKSIIDTIYNFQFLGATYYKNNDIGLVFNRNDVNVNSIRQYLITEDGASHFENNFGATRSLRNMYFLPEKSSSIGFGDYGYNLSSSLIELSKTGEYRKTLVKETGVFGARTIIENGDYYFLAGGNNFDYSNPVLTIVEK